MIGRCGRPDCHRYDLQDKFRDLVLSGFSDFYPKTEKVRRIYFEEVEFVHLLHLFHWSLVPEGKYGAVFQRRRQVKDLELHIPSATELQKCAITFQKKASGSFLDITYEGSLTKIWARMSISTVYLDDCSRDLFRNLLAFEMNFPENGYCVIAYCKCMSHILQHEDDVKLLRDQRIVAISRSYKDDNVVKLFEDLNELVKNQSTPDDLYDLYDKLRKHHSRWISNYFGRMKLQYFPNLWVRLSILGAIILFVLSILQTIYH